ncbi:MAG: hypothetical protein JW731_13685 [Bacteroidales bacterium]|nr:hypothetical protein [Bacteroidales bacterium]
MIFPIMNADIMWYGFVILTLTNSGLSGTGEWVTGIRYKKKQGKSDWDKTHYKQANPDYYFYKTDRAIFFSFPKSMLSGLNTPEILFQTGGWNTGSVREHCDATEWLAWEY